MVGPLTCGVVGPLTCGVVGPPLFWKLIKEDDEPGEDDVATKINIQLMKCCNCSKNFIW